MEDQPKQKKQRRPIGYALLCLFAAVAIWGMTPLVVKDSLAETPPGYLMFLRSLFSLPVLFSLAIAEKKRVNANDCLQTEQFIPEKPANYLKRHLTFLAVFTGVFVAAGYLLQTVGIAYTTPGKSAFLENAYCLIIPPLTWILTKSRPKPLPLVCMALCLSGVVLISLDAFDGAINVGDILCTLAGIAFGVNIVVTGLYLDRKRIFFYTFLQMTTVTSLSGLYCLLVERRVTPLHTATLLRVLFLALCATALAWVLRNRAQADLSPLTLGIVLPFSSVIGTALSVAVGQDRLTLPFLIGAALLLASILTDTLVPARTGKHAKP